MNWVTEIQNINYLAVAVATVASYALGFAWYHWVVFGEAWANALGLSKEEADNSEGLGFAFIMSLVSGLSKAVCIALLMSALSVSGIFEGALFGIIVSAVFTVTSLGYYNGFARTPSKLTLINASHSFVELTVIGAIIGILG